MHNDIKIKEQNIINFMSDFLKQQGFLLKLNDKQISTKDLLELHSLRYDSNNNEEIYLSVDDPDHKDGFIILKPTKGIYVIDNYSDNLVTIMRSVLDYMLIVHNS